MGVSGNEELNLIAKFLDFFNDSVLRVMKETLDEDICQEISIEVESAEETQNSEELKEGNIVFKTEYATGHNQGSAALLIPEDLIFKLSDILTGGKGDKAFKGELSELEINSTTDLILKIFKDMEAAFKHSYNQDLAFSSNPKFLTKESSDYSVNTEHNVFDVALVYSFKLDADKKFSITILLNKESATRLTIDLGLLKVNSSVKKLSDSALDIEKLADVKISIIAELGRTRVPIKYALELVKGSLIELDTLNNSDIKVYANGVEFAYAQVVAIEDNFGLKITKIVSPAERMGCI